MTGELSDAQLHEIFDQKIRPELDSLGASSRAQQTASLVIVGGQPGAGKSKAVQRAAAQHPGIVEVIGDDLRVYHPDYRRLMARSPLEMPAVTAQASGQWVGMSIDYLREQRKSTLIETTLRQLPVVQETIEKFHRAGYRTELHIVAVPLEVSRLGTISRYIGQVQDNGAGRWTPAVAHDVAAAAVPATAAELVRSGYVEHVVVENRVGAPYYDARPGPSQRGIVAAGVVAAIDAARDPANLTPAEARQWLATATADVRACASTRQTDADLLGAIRQTVQHDGPAVAEAAYRGDLPAQKNAVDELRAAARPLAKNTLADRISQRVQERKSETPKAPKIKREEHERGPKR